MATSADNMIEEPLNEDSGNENRCDDSGVVNRHDENVDSGDVSRHDEDMDSGDEDRYDDSGDEGASIIRNTSMMIEMRDEDEDEIRKVDAFLEKGCGCKLYNKKPCCLAFSRDHYCWIRDQCAAFDRSTLSTLIFGHVMATLNTSSTTSGMRHSSKERERNTTVFMHEGRQVSLFKLVSLGGIHKQVQATLNVIVILLLRPIHLHEDYSAINI